MGVGRLIVHSSIADDVFKRLMSALGNVQSGNSSEPLGFEAMGPLSFAGHVEKLNSIISDLVKCGGTVHIAKTTRVETVGSSFFLPRLITGVPHTSASELELFGPVATFHTFESTDQALALANENTGKLAAFLFSTNVEPTMAFGALLSTGMVMVNGVGHAFNMKEGVLEPEMEFWNDAGYGIDGSPSVLIRFFTGRRVVGPNGPAKLANS